MKIVKLSYCFDFVSIPCIGKNLTSNRLFEFSIVLVYLLVYLFNIGKSLYQKELEKFSHTPHYLISFFVLSVFFNVASFSVEIENQYFSLMPDRIPSVPPYILPVPVEIERPLWSVMIPTYNCIAHLSEALRGPLQQDPGKSRMQIEVVDDHSTDGDVGALVNEFGKNRVKFFRQKMNVGSLRNFETCLSHSKGQWIHLLHGDDRILPGFYNEIEQLFNDFPEAGAAFTNFSFMDDHGRVLDVVKEKISDTPGILKSFVCEIAKRQLIQPPAIVVKRSVYEKLGGFYAVHYGEDWEMWSRIASHFAIAYSPKILAHYRVSNKSGISYQSFRTGQNIRDIRKVIDIIKGYLPESERKKITKFAKEHYSISCIRLATSLLLHNSDVALIQAKGALKMYRSYKTYFWAVRFYLIYLFRIKQLREFYRRKFCPRKIARIS